MFLSQAPTTVGSGRFPCLRFRVVAGVLLDRPSSGLHIDLGCRLSFVKPLLATPPRLGKRRRATQEALAKNFDRKGACTAAALPRPKPSAFGWPCGRRRTRR